MNRCDVTDAGAMTPETELTEMNMLDALNDEITDDQAVAIALPTAAAAEVDEDSTLDTLSFGPLGAKRDDDEEEAEDDEEVVDDDEEEDDDLDDDEDEEDDEDDEDEDEDDLDFDDDDEDDDDDDDAFDDDDE